MFVLIRGAGDIATGIALRLWRSGMRWRCWTCRIRQPSAGRSAFPRALRFGTQKVEDVTAKKATSTAQVPEILAQGCIPVLADPEGESIPILKPDVLVDAILAKKNLGTKITDAPVVIGVGPGFYAGGIAMLSWRRCAGTIWAVHAADCP